MATYQLSNAKVVHCKICNSGPYCITTYEDQTIRVWDIRTIQTVQTLQLATATSLSFLYIMRDDSFILGAKDISFFSNSDKESNRNKLLIPPQLFKATFNLYHKVLVSMSR